MDGPGVVLTQGTINSLNCSLGTIAKLHSSVYFGPCCSHQKDGGVTFLKLEWLPDHRKYEQRFSERGGLEVCVVWVPILLLSTSSALLLSLEWGNTIITCSFQSPRRCSLLNKHTDTCLWHPLSHLHWSRWSPCACLWSKLHNYGSFFLLEMAHLPAIKFLESGRALRSNWTIRRRNLFHHAPYKARCNLPRVSEYQTGGPCAIRLKNEWGCLQVNISSQNHDVISAISGALAHHL